MQSHAAREGEETRKSGRIPGRTIEQLSLWSADPIESQEHRIKNVPSYNMYVGIYCLLNNLCK